MNVSVAMTTYNGEKFLEEQINSIFSQSVLPDELVICDDASSDNTVKLIEKLMKQSPINIRLSINKQNLGFQKNFEQCIGKCSGEIICTCDQDDVWRKDKIEVIRNTFENDSSLIMFFSDASIVDMFGKQYDYEDEISLNRWDTRKDKTNLIDLLRIIVEMKGTPYGCTMAFKKDLFLKATPFPIIGHDIWLSLCAPLYGNVFASEEKLINYRRHNANTSGNRPSIITRLKTWNKEAWFTHSNEFKKCFETYCDRFNERIPLEIKEELMMRIEFQQLLEDITLCKCWGGI